VLTSLSARRLLIAVLCTLLPLGALLGVGVSAQANSNDDPDGVGLTVGVIGSTATPSTGTPSPTASSPAAPSPAGSVRPSAGSTGGTSSTGGTGGAASVSTRTIPAGPAATQALGPNPVTLAGALAVSGLSAHPNQNVGPGGGDLVLDFTVKNLTTDPFTSSVRFWVDNALGFRIQSVDDFPVADLAGGETRTLTVTLTDVGQWIAFNNHVTFTPPESVGKTALTPVTRDATLLVPPYFLLMVGSLLGAIYLVARYAVLTRKLFPVGVGEPVS